MLLREAGWNLVQTNVHRTISNVEVLETEHAISYLAVRYAPPHIQIEFSFFNLVHQMFIDS